MNNYMFLCTWKIIKKNNINAMAKNIQYTGMAMIIIGAIILILSHAFGWNNYNWVNVGSVTFMIAGLITYILAGKKALEENK